MKRYSNLCTQAGNSDTLLFPVGRGVGRLEALFRQSADGWMSAFPSTFPKQCRELQEVVMVEKDLEKGQKIWNKWIPFINILVDPEINAQVHWLELLKWAVCAQGVPVGVPRRPLKELDEKIKAKMKKPLEMLVG